MNQERIAVFLYEGPNDIQFIGGRPPYAAYSHFTHCFLIAHEAIRTGWKVYFYQANGGPCVQISQIYPEGKIIDVVDFADPEFEPDIIFAVNSPAMLAIMQQKKPKSIGAFIINAHYWLEGETHRSDIVEWLRVGIARNIDFVLTQNERMQDLAYYLMSLIGRWHWRDRIIAAPNTFARPMVEIENAKYDRTEIRKQMGVSSEDIVIINSGGPWSWTDTDSFALAFAQVLREGAKRLRYIQMGIIQKDNAPQQKILPFWEKYLQDNEDLCQEGKIKIFTDWAEASACLPGWNYGADIGLNVSKDTAENYQSHRVRLMDYAKAGLPVLNTTGNYYATYDAKDAVMLAEPGNIESYRQLLWQLERGEINLAEKRTGMLAFRETIMSDHQIPPVLEHMVNTGRIPRTDRAEVAHHLEELYHSIAEHQFAQNFKLPDAA